MYEPERHGGATLNLLSIAIRARLQAAAVHVHDEGGKEATALGARPRLAPRPAHGVEENKVAGAVQVPVLACCSRMVSAAFPHRAHRVFPLHGRQQRATCRALELLSQLDRQWQCESEKSISRVQLSMDRSSAFRRRERRAARRGGESGAEIGEGR